MNEKVKKKKKKERKRKIALHEEVGVKMSRSWFLRILQNELKVSSKPQDLCKSNWASFVDSEHLWPHFEWMKTVLIHTAGLLPNVSKVLGPEKLYGTVKGKLLLSLQWVFSLLHKTDPCSLFCWQSKHKLLDGLRYQQRGVEQEWSLHEAGACPPSWQVRHAICKTCSVGRSQVQQFWLRTQTPRQTDWSLPSYSVRQNL